ncbi:PREDICTED: uncharacterized protein LOC108766797 [Trachymyrmex cornetzi]|uniref:uncharacterized protein LOC108766797 n=1 Tax=Trachymyrmex cornetzi TaxID=471704 RepID=UPI00084F078B|nr:PREDICTED: uncharacterized protein LOC108766797 [Trachymyrmex cornetzi]
MSDIDDNDNIDIDDEVLIAIVQQNPCLYAKSDANYKDHEVKEMKWETISESLNCTANEAKKRWDSLRSQFSRKLQQQKMQPSGSGVMPEWPLMSCMSFLKSHIQNRKTRGSTLLRTTSSICSELSNRCSINSFIRQSLASVRQSPTSVGQSPASVSQSPTSVGQSPASVSQSPTSVGQLSTSVLQSSTFVIATPSCSTLSTQSFRLPDCLNQLKISLKRKKIVDLFVEQTFKKHAKKILVPSLDNFTKKRKANNERLEELLRKSSLALSDMATTYKNKATEEKRELDPNAVVISQALKSVIKENQLSYLIAVLQLIEKFKD